MDEDELLARIVINPAIFGGKPIVRGHRMAVEQILGMLVAGETTATILDNFPWLESDDIKACLLYAQRVVGSERVVPRFVGSAA